MARLPESHSSTGAEPRGQPDPTNEVFVLCAGTVVRKRTCGTPTEWVAAALSFGNKHRNDHILAFHLRERKKGRLEVVCRSSCGTHLPACPWERPEQAVLGQSSWDKEEKCGLCSVFCSASRRTLTCSAWGSAPWASPGPLFPSCLTGASCEWCGTHSLACSLL